MLTEDIHCNESVIKIKFIKSIANFSSWKYCVKTVPVFRDIQKTNIFVLLYVENFINHPFWIICLKLLKFEEIFLKENVFSDCFFDIFS